MPPEYSRVLGDSAPWTHERFLALFASRPHVHEIVVRFLDSVEPPGTLAVTPRFGPASVNVLC